MFSNCGTNKTIVDTKVTKFYYPRTLDFKNDSILSKVELDSIKNYGELIMITDKIVCEGKTPVLKLHHDNSEFNIIVFKMCSQSNSVADYRKRNVIAIEKNSIIINDEIEKSFTNLKSVLRNHIVNPKKKSEYSQNIEKSLIFYYQDSLFGKEEIKKQLITIASEFNELNRKNGDSLPLKIKLNDYPHIRIHIPIPPPPIEN